MKELSGTSNAREFFRNVKFIFFVLTFWLFNYILNYGFGFRPVQIEEYAAGDHIVLSVFATADSLRDSLVFDIRDLPEGANVFELGRCGKCRSRRWQLQFNWYSLSTDTGSYHPRFIVRNRAGEKDTLDIPISLK